MSESIYKSEKKQDGFRDEQYFIIPTEAFAGYAAHPMIKALYLTDVGYFPDARNHFKERDEGIEEYIFFYCTGGAGIIQVEDCTYEITAGDAFCIPRYKRHKYYASGNNPWSIFWVHFKGANATLFPLNECSIIKMNTKYANNRMIFLFDLLFRVLERNYTVGNFIYISQVLSLILAEVYYREKADETSAQNKHITLIIRYMYKHIKENITLDDISVEFNLSKGYINDIFNKYAKKSPISFFINLKMHEACKLLKSTNMLIGQVAYSLGYEDQYYFSRIFKKFVGISPKDYKNSEFVHYK